MNGLWESILHYVIHILCYTAGFICYNVKDWVMVKILEHNQKIMLLHLYVYMFTFAHLYKTKTDDI